MFGNIFGNIFSRLGTMHERDGQTDVGTPDDSKDRVNAQRRAEKNNVNFWIRTIIPGYGIIPKRIRLNK